MMSTMHAIFLMQMMLLAGVTTGFLSDVNDCATGNVCSCNNERIYCYNRGLTDVPVFNITGTGISIRELNFGYNAIDTLTNDSFSFLRNLTAASMFVYFNNNNLSIIDDRCFEELKHAIIYLDLGYNNLKTIPMAISTLTHLNTLSLLYNPILYFDPNILFIISDTLQTLFISLNKVSRWPNELHFLYNLQELRIYQFSANTIRASDFEYITEIKSLQTLMIQQTNLEEFPAPFCDLSNVRYLNLDFNHFSGGKDIFSVCHRPLSNMSTLSLSYNQLEYFPDLGIAFSEIETLYLSNNNIRYLTDELSAMPQLKVLVLNDNKLFYIPSTLASIAPNLRELWVVYNLIVDIDDQALGGLSNLRWLSFNGNPLEYIAEHAFSHNPGLTFLFVSATKLLTLPCALSITSNQLINVYTDRIECDCRMQCLKNITLSNLILGGQLCLQTNITIEHFIQTVIKADKCG